MSSRFCKSCKIFDKRKISLILNLPLIFLPAEEKPVLFFFSFSPWVQETQVAIFEPPSPPAERPRPEFDHPVSEIISWWSSQKFRRREPSLSEPSSEPRLSLGECPHCEWGSTPFFDFLMRTNILIHDFGWPLCGHPRTDYPPPCGVGKCCPNEQFLLINDYYEHS